MPQLKTLSEALPEILPTAQETVSIDSKTIVNAPPCSLYVHIPWCVKKCPYCDFNSHVSPDFRGATDARANTNPQKILGELPEQAYLSSLLNDLQNEINHFQSRRELPSLVSVFFGGGTPSLMSPRIFAEIIAAAEKQIGFSRQMEVTLEANPGAVDREKFAGFFNAGINRLSLGVQSFSPQQLKRLGRIHQRRDIDNAYNQARQSKFNNINLDLMFGLPEQTPEQALQDLELAIAMEPEHISWYQLTIEPNTAFFRQPPALPNDDIVWEIHQAGIRLLRQAGFEQYEISAFARPYRNARHNLNYWKFGDYLAIGAGAHGKCTDTSQSEISRHWKTRLPKDYMSRIDDYRAGYEKISRDQLPIEYLMNALRLRRGVSEEAYVNATGLEIASLQPQLQQLRSKALVEQERLQCTDRGYAHLNTLLGEFIAD